MIDFEQVEDQIRAKQKSIRYDIRSHSISDLINRFQHGDLYIPTTKGILCGQRSLNLYLLNQ